MSHHSKGYWKFAAETLKTELDKARTAPAEHCKGCGDDIVGFASDGYCEDCLCTECGNTMSTEDERAATMCEECDIARAVAEWL